MKKYIESHWLIFLIQGAIALIFGWYIMFTGVTDLPALIHIVALALLALGIVETLNAIDRKRRKHNWALALTIAVLEIAVALALLIVKDLTIATQLSIIATYTILRGVFETMIGVRSVSGHINKFLWIITGMFGIILGFAILNSGNLDPHNTSFIKIFGTYLMVFGLTSTIFSIHSKSLANLPAPSPKKKSKSKK